MTHHELHALAARIAREEHLTHSEALSRLARRPRRSRTTVKPGAFATIEPPRRPYWWQKDT